MSACPDLLGRFDVIHLCGRGKLDLSCAQPGYLQYEYITEELPDLFHLADVVLSRAGDADGEQQVVLDYVLPPYRDFTPGEFVFRADGPFAEMGARRVVASPAMTASERYLAAVGFVPDDAGRRVLHLAGAARPEG